jgi:membrane protease YdiL (CAAX protease family)
VSTGTPPTLPARPERPEGLPPARPADERPWRPLLAIPIAIVSLVAGVVAFAVAAAIRDAVVSAPIHRPGVAGAAAHGTPPLLTLISTFVQDVTLIAGVGIAVAIALGGRLRAAALGLRPARIVPSAALVVGGYVAFLIISAAWTSWLGITDRENVPVSLGTRDSAGALIGAILVVCAVAPMAEELFFRGFLFGSLRKRGFPIAAGVSGITFGLAHVASSPIGFLVPLAILGVLLCLVYERTGSLYPCIALHCLNNSVAFGVGDGRIWLVPVCLVVAGAVIVVTLRAAGHAFATPAAAR